MKQAKTLQALFAAENAAWEALGKALSVLSNASEEEKEALNKAHDEAVKKRCDFQAKS